MAGILPSIRNRRGKGKILATLEGYPYGRKKKGKEIKREKYKTLPKQGITGLGRYTGINYFTGRYYRGSRKGSDYRKSNLYAERRPLPDIDSLFVILPD